MTSAKTAKKPVTANRSSVKPGFGAASDRPRRLKLPAYRPLRLKHITYPEKLPSVWRLTARTVQLFWGNWKLFLGITIVYAALALILVQGLGGNTDVVSLKGQFNFGSDPFSQVITGLTVFATLFTSSGSSSSVASGPYQLIVGLVISLATIWAARQVLAGQIVRIRDAFYRGMYPLIPFVLVLLVVLIQSMPFLIGAWLYTNVVNSGAAATGLEQALWGLLFLVLTICSVYMLCSSLFALYIVTLPDMTPIKALRSARQLVHYRRGQVFRKLLYLPVALLVVAAVIILPVIVFAAPAAPWVFFALATVGLIVAHLYMYTVYKALLA